MKKAEEDEEMEWSSDQRRAKGQCIKKVNVIAVS